jgi:nucleoid-associated protein YgaU
MILPSSRYADSPVVTVVAPGTFGGGDISVIVPSMQQPFSFRYISHLVVAGERIDTLAAQYYGDPTMWWRVADANPSIMWYDDIMPGTILRVPVLT